MITVYTGPGCSACHATTAWLTRKGIAYEAIDISRDAMLAHALREEGHTELPVVVTDNGTWTGFRIDRLEGLDR